MRRDSVRLSYLPQLDSFRFFAVFLVIISHWLPFSTLSLFPNGFIGVTFFFVLSGFLISSILLFAKKEINKNSISFWQAIKTFYARRTLRIFPLYFLVIFLVFALTPALFNGHFIWYLTYTPNFLIFQAKVWPGMLSHFWSLGVEEQFYLIWPFLIFICPWSYLKYLFTLIIVLSIGFKLLFFHWDGPFFNYYDVLPISCFDAFGVGALLALFIIERKNNTQFSLNFKFSAALVGNIFFAWLVFISRLSFLFGLAVSLCSMLLVWGAIRGYGGWGGLIVKNRMIQYFGKISYGLYVYHNFIPWLVRCIRGTETAYPLPIKIIHLVWLQRPVVIFLFQFILLVVISSFSWYLIERPINKMKKYFV